MTKALLKSNPAQGRFSVLLTRGQLHPRVSAGGVVRGERAATHVAFPCEDQLMSLVDACLLWYVTLVKKRKICPVCKNGCSATKFMHINHTLPIIGKMFHGCTVVFPLPMWARRRKGHTPNNFPIAVVMVYLC